jgi:uncharacterized membrane protein YbhN (UPF0104 family)
MAAASALLVWAATTQDALPGFGDLPELPSFDFAWFLDNPLSAQLVLGVLVLVAIGLAVWIHGHVVDFWQRVRQAFAVVRRPALYLRTVAFWQACDWTLRVVTIWFMLDAFGIPQTLENALLVQVSASVATLVPLTPGGIGTEQAFLLYVFRGAVSNAELLAYSVGAKLIIVATNVVAGFTAIGLTLRTFRYSKALAPEARSAELETEAEAP